MHLYHYFQDATLVMGVLLGMVCRKVHAQKLTKYVRMMALVQVRAITAIDNKIVYNIITIMSCRFYKYGMYLYHFLQDATMVMEVLLGMVR